MTNGNLATFIDTVYSGQEVFFSAMGKIYVPRIYGKRYLPYGEPTAYSVGFRTILHTQSTSMQEYLEEFEKAPIFNGKSFWDIESEIEWVDE